MSDFSTLEKLYAKGVLDINGKDFINGTNSGLQVNSNRDAFLPDSRFMPVDGAYMRRELDKDTFSSSGILNTPLTGDGCEEEKKKTSSAGAKLKSVLTSKVTAEIVATLGLVLSGRYILKKLHILK